MTESSLTTPPAVSTPPSWIEVCSLDDVFDAVENVWGAEVRQAMELRWDDLSDVLGEGSTRKIRIWADTGVLESASVEQDALAESPLALASDPDPVNASQADALGRFIEITSDEHANDTLRTYGPKLYFWVDRYQHSGVDYAVSGTRYQQPDFDVSQNCAVFVPHSDMQADYKRLRKTLSPLEARRTFVDAANRQLTAFTSWSNGDVYAVEVRTFDRQGRETSSDRLPEIMGMDEVDASIERCSEEQRASLTRPPLPSVSDVPAESAAPSTGRARPRAGGR